MKIVAAIVVLLVATSGVVLPATAASEEFPWTKAQAVVTATETDLKQGGPKVIGPHAADLEQALAGADRSSASFSASDGTVYVLVDGTTEALLAVATPTENKTTGGKARQVVAVNNPYPVVSLYLGSYYNEVGKPTDALRVLDAGLALPAVMEIVTMGAHRPLLIRERGAALIALKRWPDALANFDNGLKLDPLEDPDHAGLLRGRGFALTELGRLDEAEQSYRDSLKFDPNSPVAQSELKYLTQLRAGGAKEPTVLTTQPPSKPQ